MKIKPMKGIKIILLVVALVLMQACAEEESPKESAVQLLELDRITYDSCSVTFSIGRALFADLQIIDMIEDYKINRTCSGECTYISNAEFLDEWDSHSNPSFDNRCNDAGDWAFDIPSTDPAAERRPYRLIYILEAYINGKWVYCDTYETPDIVERPYPWQE